MINLKALCPIILSCYINELYLKCMFFSVSNSGYTCLVTACYKNHPTVVSRLLTRTDVDPNWRSEEGDSLLMTCCARSYNNIIELLVSRADLDINYTGQR